jgi:DNA replication protein DnaD
LARPKREGLEYFPLDVNAGLDDEIELVEAEYGLEGFAIFIKLLQKIYKSNYYIMWTEKEKLQFSKRVNVDINRVNVIIMSCLKWGLFNQMLYDSYNILTSRGIQKRFLLAIDRRTSYEFYREYLLLNENEVNVYKNLVIVSKTPDYVDINPQRERERESKEKVKESKEKEKVNNADINSLSLTLSKEVEKLSNGKWYIAKDKEKLNVLIEMYSYDWTREAILTGISKGKHSLGYVEGILRNWQVEEKEEAHGGTRANNAESQGKYTGFKPPEPNIPDDLDSSGLI